MKRVRDLILFLLIVAMSSFLWFAPAHANGQEPTAQEQQATQHTLPADAATPEQPAQDPPAAAQPATPQGAAQQSGPAGNTRLVVTVGKSLIIDSPLDIRRISVANGELAEAVAVNPREVLINGKGPGETSLIIWQDNGARLVYDLTVRVSASRVDAVRQQIARDFPNEDVSVTFENDTAFVRGTVKDVIAAERVMSMASTLGKTVNLLRVLVPDAQPQVMLKVRFANVDHSASRDLGVDFYNGSFNQQSTIGTGGLITKDGSAFDLASAVNVLLFRKDINLVAAIRALESKRQFEMLAEPNLLTLSGQPASFLAGGEFPFPVVQPGGQGGAAISIMWREFGIRLNFLPEVTPRGTIRMKVSPEVSSLDYTNSVSVLGQTIPGLSSRRVQTDVELDSGQSFVIAGLLDRHTTENMSKVPGIGSLPIIGKLFQSKLVSRANTELLVIITPELVRPIPAGDPLPALKYQDQTLNSPDTAQVSQPSSNKLGPAPVRPPAGSLPVEQLIQKQGQPQQTAPMMPAPTPITPAPPAVPGNGAPQAAAPVAGSGGAR